MINKRVIREFGRMQTDALREGLREKLRNVRKKQWNLERELEELDLTKIEVTIDIEDFSFFGPNTPYDCLSSNPNLRWEWVKQDPEKWDFDRLSGNARINSEIFENPHLPWVAMTTARNPSLPWDKLCQIPRYHPSLFLVSKNPNVTWEIIQANPDFPWDPDGVSMNPNVTWEIVQQHPSFPWNFRHMSSNPNITWEIIKANPRKWDYAYLSRNPSLTWEIVRDNPGVDWDFAYLSANPCITWETIQQNPQFPWDTYQFSLNPNVSWQIVRENPCDWHYGHLLSNGMGREKLDHQERELLDQLVALQVRKFRDLLVERISRPGGYYYQQAMKDFEKLKKS